MSVSSKLTKPILKSERRVPRALLPPFESAYALTIHQSQGSESVCRRRLTTFGEPIAESRAPLHGHYTSSDRVNDLRLRESLATCLKRSHSATPGLVDLILEGFRTVGSSNRRKPKLLRMPIENENQHHLSY